MPLRKTKRASYCGPKVDEIYPMHHLMIKPPASFPILGPGVSEHSLWYTDI